MYTNFSNCHGPAKNGNVMLMNGWIIILLFPKLSKVCVTAKVALIYNFLHGHSKINFGSVKKYIKPGIREEASIEDAGPEFFFVELKPEGAN